MDGSQWMMGFCYPPSNSLCRVLCSFYCAEQSKENAVDEASSCTERPQGLRIISDLVRSDLFVPEDVVVTEGRMLYFHVRVAILDIYDLSVQRL